MKHYIIAKFKPGFDLEAHLDDIACIFARTKQIAGVREARLYPGVHRTEYANRYDLMIEIEMDDESLKAYNDCAPHHEWKDKYGKFIEAKCIFDRE